jgi:hypothetical protein
LVIRTDYTYYYETVVNPHLVQYQYSAVESVAKHDAFDMIEDDQIVQPVNLCAECAIEDEQTLIKTVFYYL